jgi:hypothetical protein
MSDAKLWTPKVCRPSSTNPKVVPYVAHVHGFAGPNLP